MNRSMKIRVLSMVLAVVMLIGLAPMNAFAAETEPQSTAPETVIVKFDVNGGIGEYESQQVTLGDKVTKPEEDPTHETAVFAYWTADLEANKEWNFEEDVVAEEMTLYASWITPTADTEPQPTETDPVETDPVTATYTVQHYLQTAEGYALDEAATETLSGEVGAATNAAAKVYDGYTANPFEQAVIAEDGSTVVMIHYSKNPVVAAATENGLPSDMTLLSEKKSTLAPGITERQLAVYDKNGDRVLMFIATADTSVDTVKIYANYKDNQNLVYGMQKTTDQAAAFEANHDGENVIVAINASYFNTSTGKPTGTFVMEGIDVTNESEGNNYPFFALLKDGTYMIGAKGEYSSYKGQIQEAIGGYIHLVKDGAICSGLNKTEKYPRQTIGITADGRVILMTADNLAAVGSNGLTIQEQAEVMLALGCVEALHLDGGGSATYCSQAAGTNTLEVVNNPSNGTERTVSSTLIFVSTAKATGEFDRAILTAEHGYVTPGSVVNVTAIGIDASGGSAEIPGDVVWQLADSNLGTVENGVFTSNGTLGTAVVQMVHNGTVVGETAIGVVNPDSLSFGGMTTVVIPYGKSVELPLVAYYGVNEVFYNAADFQVVLADADAATVSGLTVTAPSADSGITGTELIVSLKANEAVAISAALAFGKGSEVVFDFEEGTASANLDNWIVRTHESKIDNNEQGEIYIVNKDTGLVHDGEQALAFHADFSQAVGHASNTGGYIALSLSWGGDPVDIKGAQSVGFWLYIPEDAMTTEITLNTIYYNANGTPARRTPDASDDDGEMIYTPYWRTHMEESGWHYVKADLSGYSDDLLIKDEPKLDSAFKRNFFIKIFCVFGSEAESFADYHGDFTYYIDNVTVDYSSAVEDRELPVFGDPCAYGAASEKRLAYGSVVDVAESNLTFAANVTDNMRKNNYTGINAASAKVYVDGNSVGATYANGTISSGNVSLTNGYHRIKFEIADNNGNVKSIVREINVRVDTELPAVGLVPHDAALDRLYSGSVYWVDLISNDIANIKSIDAVLNLNSIHDWELDHMIVADGFDVTWSATAAQNAEKNVTLKITRNSETIASDSNVIVSIPVRVWESLIYTYPGLEKYTPQYTWETAKGINHRQLRVRVDQGLVTYTDDTKSYFSDKIVVDHEAYTDYYLMDQAYWNERGTYHTHTATAVEDVAETCTEDGYTGRTYCEVCDSVVDWGTAIKASGHTYELTDGVLKCECGDLFSGVYTDGKTYVDGVVLADGWVGESYYVSGVKLTGVQKVPAPDSTEEFYYNFGEDGICVNKIKYEGVFLDESAGVYRYSKMGVITSGWLQVDADWYYFDASTMAAHPGELQIGEITFTFEQTGKLSSGVWAKTLHGYRYYYGPGYHKDGWETIDGKDYFFEKGYRVEGGYQCVFESYTTALWYYFEEDGSCNKANVIPDGFYTDRNGYGYSRNGVGLQGVHQIDGTYYYFNSKGYAQTGEYGGYLFGDDYKAYTGLVDKKGVTYYYKNGRPYTAGLVEVDGAYYFANGSNGEIAVDTTCYIWQGNGIIPESTRSFGKDGKLLDGIVEINGILYYYDMGQAKPAGLVEIDGAYYFASGSNGEIAVDTTCYVWQGNGIVPESTRSFGKDGKMLDGIIERDGGYYYYEMGQPKMAGLICIDGVYYFARNGEGELVTNQTYYVWQSNGLLPEANYQFDELGRIRDGIVEINGTLYYYEGGKPKVAGLVEVDGAYYFAKGSNGEIAVDTTCYVWQGNGIIPESTRTFGPDGKLLDGIVERSGTLYYYVMGQARVAGLVEVDGAYYFANGSNGEVAVDTTCYVWQGNGIIPESNRSFGKDGKLLDGIVDINGTLCYYVMGQPKTAGLVEVDGAYYFAKGSKGEIAVDTTCYVWQGNGILPESNRTFDADGKLLDGFVTKEDGIYYYEDGQTGMVGLNYIDGYYYFVGVDGKLVTNRTYYVWQTNGLSICMNYTFDELGRAVL